MQTRWPRSRISPVFCEEWPTIDRLARDVRAGDAVAERLPAQDLGGLLIHRQVRFVLGVDEDVRLGLVVVATASEEREVLGGDPRQIGPCRSTRPGSVRRERGIAPIPSQLVTTAKAPHGACSRSIEEHLVVIAQESGPACTAAPARSTDRARPGCPGRD